MHPAADRSLQQSSNHSVSSPSSKALPPFPAFPSSPPSAPLLHFHPPTSAPHMYLHPDHLTAAHSGPGHHLQDHTVLHTQLPLTFPCADAADGDGGDDDGARVGYFEVRLLDVGKKGELFVGLLSADSQAVDPQLIAELKARAQPSGAASAASAAPAPLFSAQSLASASPPLSSALPSLPYSSSSQRQLGSEHPLSVAIQLHTGRLYSVQHAKGLPFLPSFGAGDTIGVGFVFAALSASPSSSFSSNASNLHSPNGSLFAPSSLSSLSSSASAFPAPSIPASSLTLSSYLFFTKNGKLLADKEVSMDHVHLTPCSAAVAPLSSLFFPALSFHSPSESVVGNFGQSPFAFDLSAFEAELRERETRLRREVEYEKALMLPMIKEYLLWHGYDGTLQVLEESEGAELEARVRWTASGTAPRSAGGKDGDDGVRRSVQVRGRIRQLIQASKVDEALALLRQHYPSSARRGLILFLLHSLHFIAILTSPHPPPTPGLSRPMRALLYARQHLATVKAGSEQEQLLPRITGLLALREEDWEGNELMGSEWREHVADRVNEEMVRIDRSGNSTQRREGEGAGEGEEERTRAEGEGRSEGRDSDGMDVDETDKVNWVEVSEGDGDSVIGSAVEVLIAQLLAVDAVWRHQRPLLPRQTAWDEANKRAEWWLEQR